MVPQGRRLGNEFGQFGMLNALSLLPNHRGGSIYWEKQVYGTGWLIAERQIQLSLFLFAQQSSFYLRLKWTYKSIYLWLSLSGG